MTQSIQAVGFIGLGNIGKPMAANLLKGRFSTWVYDVFPEAAKSLSEQGAIVAQSINELAQNCPLIGLCVRDDKDVEQVVAAILAQPSACQTIMIHSTVRPQTIIQQAELAKAHGILLIDAPITGGASAAANASLCTIIGAKEAELAFALSYFQCFSQELIFAGALGQGMIAKLCNNLITYAEFTALYEALRLAKAAGLDSTIVQKVGAANGNITPQMRQFASLHDYKSHFSSADFERLAGGFAAVAEKDLSIALEQAEHYQETLAASQRVLQQIGKVYRDDY